MEAKGAAAGAGGVGVGAGVGEAGPKVRWLRVAGVLLLAWALVEAGSQVWVRCWAGSWYKTFSKYRWSPYGMVRNNPGVTSPFFRINKNGFRNEEDFAQAKPEETFRVLMLGASTLYSGIGGWYPPDVKRVDSGHTIAQYLRDELRKDPALAGLKVEVLNTAVNGTRISEVCPGYLCEYRFWDPDLVIVCGSANNFGHMAEKGAVYRRQHVMQEPSGWLTDFDRLANTRSFAVLGETAILTLDEHLASVALFRTVWGKVFEIVNSRIQQAALVPRPVAARGAADAEPASWDEYNRYLEEYLGYVDAMLAAARHQDQPMVFFWEYYIGHLGGIRPFDKVEEELYLHNRAPNYRRDAEFDFYTRDRLAEHCKEQGTILIDPIEDLKTYRGNVFIDYLHYTAEGNALMAKVMYRNLRTLIHERAKKARAKATPGS